MDFVIKHVPDREIEGHANRLRRSDGEVFQVLVCLTEDMKDEFLAHNALLFDEEVISSNDPRFSLISTGQEDLELSIHFKKSDS